MEPYKSYGRNNNCNRNMNSYDNRRNYNARPMNDSCGCDFSALQKVENEQCCEAKHSENANHKPIAMAYVPMQKWEHLYDPENALFQGTAFPSLNLVFCGVRGKM